MNVPGNESRAIITKNLTLSEFLQVIHNFGANSGTVQCMADFSFGNGVSFEDLAARLVDRVRFERKRLQLSQSEFAMRCNIPLRTYKVSSWVSVIHFWFSFALL
jgi:hypothetical protein